MSQLASSRDGFWGAHDARLSRETERPTNHLIEIAVLESNERSAVRQARDHLSVLPRPTRHRDRDCWRKLYPYPARLSTLKQSDRIVGSVAGTVRGLNVPERRADPWKASSAN